MRLENISGFSIPDKTTLTGDNRPLEPKQTLKPDTVLVASPGCENDLGSGRVEPFHGL